MQRISWTFVHEILSNLVSWQADRQTNKQTNKQQIENITSFGERIIIDKGER